ncbi:MAG TPA: two-component system response regulator [Gallionella sp.]|jgi:DNA-binding NtrC family response regulator|nr:response regulator [Gallionella sp.]OGS68391.1 MAG: two-component system response regulator [Gallionellales bacterium GWA2_54_124]OGT17600.1 MAG: two-component system response regulator [Gallionellales bacterium RIFOXYD12_FULL_53_10]HCI54108.1 two-component system response regulator [Gallionella sp.]
MSKQILVVDDEVGIRELLAEILFDEGYQIHLAENAEQARAFRHEQEPDLVLLDIWMPDTDGVTLLKEWVEQDLLTMPVVMMSGHGTIETAVEATLIGAVDFLEKPISMQKLLNTVAKAIREGAPRPPMAVTETDVSQKITVEIGGATKQFALPLDLPLREAREHFDAIYFDYHLQMEAGNVSRVAEKIGVERTHLHRKLKQLGIKVIKKSGESES